MVNMLEKDVDLFEAHRAKYERAYSTGVLTPEVHWRLVENLPRYTRAAGVIPSDVWTPFDEVCGTEEEMAFVTGYDENPSLGLVYVGRFDPVVDRRMRVLAGLFLRNFLTARVASAEVLVSEALSGAVESVTALFIPDFCTQSSSYPDVRSRFMYSLIVGRLAEGHTTVVWSHEAQAVGASMGVALRDLMQDNFVAVKGAPVRS